MAQAGPSRQELIQQGNRAGFVGRDAERAEFLANFDIPLGDPRQRFRFHVHGTAGVGKTFLVQELRHLARERGALTAYVDESAGSVPEALAEICGQFSDQGRRLKDLERRLAAYRDRRREAEAAALAALAPESGAEPGPSTGSRAAVELGIAMAEATVPGGSLIGRVLPADQLAQGGDRLRASLGARFRNSDDIELVTSPEKVLTPVLLRELRATAAASASRSASASALASEWIVLFFDTYERTGAYLDPWLHDMVTRGSTADSQLPATVVVVTAGQRPLDPARWSGLDSVTDVPLEPFTEAEARRLLAAKGVVAEPVVEEVLRLTGGLPVLVSTLAKERPGAPDAVGDPSATAVERFLKSEPAVRRKVAGICSLPRWLDADVFRVLVTDRPDDELDALYAWLTGLPFVGERGERERERVRVRYHDVVRAPMLRLERRRSPREWASRHRRLAESFAEWRADVGAGRDTEDLWDEDEEWRELLLEETYHRLCARPPAALAEALGFLVEACRRDAVVGRRWVRMLQDAGDATDHPALRTWGRELGETLTDEEGAGVIAAMDLLLARPGLDPAGRADAHALRGRELRDGGEYARALEEFDRAVELAPGLGLAHYGRGVTLRLMDDLPAALAAFDRADELVPDTEWIIVGRAAIYLLADRYEQAVAEFSRAVALDPTSGRALSGRAVCLHAIGRYDEALTDYNRALAIQDDHLWTLVRRARLRRIMGDLDGAFADFDRAAELGPDRAWIASERGDAYRLVERYEEAVAELGRAVALQPDYPSALASRGAALHELGRYEEALADLDGAVELRADYSWALVMRDRVASRLAEATAARDAIQAPYAQQPSRGADCLDDGG